ncbi:polysaccharide biosynthesis C-terminal domain-containing protein [Vibrio parahaemolyticus]|nr:polysaccharide biosynthesis C-terminal domain-containing protein [Vibrio parahaemolyticus]
MSSLGRFHSLSIPIYISYLVGVAFTFADNAIIGRYNIESYAVVTIVNTIMYYIIGSIGTFSLALTMQGAKHLENKQYKQYEKVFNTSLVIGMTISLLFIVFSILFGEYIFKHFFSMNEDVAEIAYRFFVLLSFGVPINILIFTISSYFKSVEKPKILAYSSIVSSLVNVLVNYVLVFGEFGFPRLGAIGVAIGTLAGLSVSLVIYSYGFFRQKDIRIRPVFDRAVSRSVIKLFSNLFVQDLFEFTVFYFFILAVISESGVVNSATYGVLTTIFMVIVMLSYSYGNALLIITRKEIDNRDEIAKYAKISLVSFVIVWLVYSFIVWLSGDLSPAVITNKSPVILNSMSHVAIFAISQLMIGLATIARYLLNGLGFENYVLKACCIVCPASGLLIYAGNTAFNFEFETVIALVSATYVLLALSFCTKACFRANKKDKYSQA